MTSGSQPEPRGSRTRRNPVESNSSVDETIGHHNSRPTSDHHSLKPSDQPSRRYPVHRSQPRHQQQQQQQPPQPPHHQQPPQPQQQHHQQEPTPDQSPHPSSSNPSKNPKPHHHHRRAKFGSKLTDQTQAPSSNLPSSILNVPSSIDPNPLSLSERLILELSNSTYDCSICISPIQPHQSIYHCPNCFAVFHLKCSTQWASRSVSDSSNRAIILRDRDRIQPSPDTLRGQWRCPGCQFNHLGPQSIPRQPSCWCGKLKDSNRIHHRNTRSNPKIPHGCGQRCAKVSADGCLHGCMEECHPGSCPPCPAVIKTNCHCGQHQLSIRCSQLHPNRNNLQPIDPQLLSCGQVCNRTSKCSLHPCQSICHPADCQACRVIRTKSCYCQRIVSNHQTCSDPIDHHLIPRPAHSPSKQDLITCVSKHGSRWLAEFSCQQPCPWKYDCDVHACQSTCHPHPTSTPLICPFSPQVLQTCPCGSTPVKSRQSCSDPIPTCDNPCGKIIQGCGHVCTKTCHLGECGPCRAQVTTICRCGKDKIVRPCIEIERLKEEAVIENELKDATERKEVDLARNEAIEYRCERVCRVLRRCGKHTCHRRCCPLSFLENLLTTGKKSKKFKQPSASHPSAQQLHEDQDPLGLHICELKCNKKLSCGLHHCQLLDHKGPCPTCLQASFDDLICHCGATVIEPPVACGTKINCRSPCQRADPSCGHPKPPHTCHEEPDCPPCPYLTEKACQCYRQNLVKNVRCSQPKASCGQTCDSLLPCGAHRCSRKCHPLGQCEERCDRDCAKPRKHCGHHCQQKCHAPSACPTNMACEVLIDLKCRCGHVTQKMQCGSCDESPGGNLDRVLTCNDDCIILQRNSTMAKALQIDRSPSSKNHVDRSFTEWDDRLIHFFDSHTLFAKAIEKQLAEFLSPDSTSRPHPSPTSKNTLIISTFSKLKQAFLIDLVPSYQIKPQALGEEPRFNVKLVKDSNSRLPIPLLSETSTNRNKNPSHQIKLLNTQDQSSTCGGSLNAVLPNSRQALGAIHRIPSKLDDRPATSHLVYSIVFQGVFGHDHQSLAALIQSILSRNNPKKDISRFVLNWIGDEDVMFRLSDRSSGEPELDRLKSIVGRLIAYFDRDDDDRQDLRFYQDVSFALVDLSTHSNDELAHKDSQQKLKIVETMEIDLNSLGGDGGGGNGSEAADPGLDGWRSSSSKPFAKTFIDFNRHSSGQSLASSTNRFSSLATTSLIGSNNVNNLYPGSSSSTPWNLSGSKNAPLQAFGEVISGGFNRPPIAVLAPSTSSTRRSTPRLETHRSDRGFPPSDRHGRRQRLGDRRQEEEVVDDWEQEEI